MNVKEKKEHYLKQVKEAVRASAKNIDASIKDFEVTDPEKSKIKISTIKVVSDADDGILFYNFQGERLPERQLIPRDLERVYETLAMNLPIRKEDE